MKILFIITGLQLGGAERQVCDISDRLADLGHDVMIICLNGNIVITPKNSSISVHSLSMKKTFFGLLNSISMCKKLVKNFKPDVIHSHMVHANIFARILRFFVRIPFLVCTAHSNNEGSSFRMFAYRLTDCLADISTNVSLSAVKTSISRCSVPSHKIEVVHNGINIEQFKFSLTDRFSIRKELGLLDSESFLLAVGRLTEAKNYPNLLNAFKIVLSKKSNAKLFIVGSGDQLENIQNMISSLSLDKAVFLLGVRNDIPAIMSASDIFVLSSAWEGFGLVVAEAMACERIVVATDCGGVKEIMGDYGYIVKNNSSFDLALAILKSLDLTQQEKLLIGKRSREKVVREFSINHVVELWLKIYTRNLTQ